MKAKLYDGIRTLVEIRANFGKRLIPEGTIGTVVECYEQPQEGYAVDLAIPDEKWVGGFDYENVILISRTIRGCECCTGSLGCWQFQ